MRHDEVPSKPLALALLTTAQFMVVLDASIVNVALPEIQTSLAFSDEHLSWVVNAYLLMLGGFLLLGGRLADLIGRRRVFIAGMLLFGVASLGGGLATAELQLIICRGAQGLGAALVSPAALSTISLIFSEGRERNNAFGVWGAAAGVGSVTGVIVGGLLTHWLGWEWIFFINVPVTLGAAALAPRLLVESRDTGHRSYDIPGAVTVTAGLTSIVYAVVDANNAGWGSPQTLGLLAGGVVLLALFVRIETRTEEPLISFSIFRLPMLRATNIYALINQTCVAATFYVFTLYMQLVLGYDALETGIGLLPLCLFTVVLAGVSSRMSTRGGPKRVLIIATAIEVVGLVWLAQMSASGSYWTDVLGPSLVLGVGFGLGLVAIPVAAMTGTERTNAGLASGLINANQQIGRAVGVALLISVYTATATDQLVKGVDRAAALADGLGSGLLVLAALCVASLVIAVFVMPSVAPKSQPEPVGP